MKPVKVCSISFSVLIALAIAVFIVLNPFESFGALVTGLIFSIMAVGVFLTFRVLNIADMSVDGTFTTGAAVSAILSVAAHPFLGVFLSLILGAAAGCITAFLHTKLKIQPLLAGIITMTGLYSINLRILGAANKQLLSYPTVFSRAEQIAGGRLGNFASFIPSFLVTAAILLLLYLFLNTEIGFSLRASGDNPDMVRSQGVSTAVAEFIGYAVSNGLVAVSGALFAQYQGFADISMGIGTVVIGLASVIIGEAFFTLLSLIFRKAAFREKRMLLLLVCVVIGAVAYRFIYAIALSINFNPNDMKLLTALIVALALAMPVIGEKLGKLFSYGPRAGKIPPSASESRCESGKGGAHHA